MEGIGAFLKGMPRRHRPPTGPLTTAEAADELRREVEAKDKERIEHEQAEATRKSDSNSP